MDLQTITNFHEKVNNDTNQILNKINNRIEFMQNHSDLTVNQEVKMNLDFMTLFNQLKANQINQIEIFNKLANLKLDEGVSVLKMEDRVDKIKILI